MVVAVNDQRSQHHLAECQDRDGHQVQFELQYLVVYQLEVPYATMYFLVFLECCQPLEIEGSCCKILAGMT